MAISYVGSASASASSIPSLPAGRQLLDLEIVWAFNSASTTQPTLPSGWKRIANNPGTTCNLVVAYRWCVDTSDTSGTWTNATNLDCEVYRGIYGAGDSEIATSTTTAVIIPANFPYQTGGNSWIAGAIGHRTATSLGTTPSGLTARGSVGTNPILAAYDTNAGVASFTNKSFTANTTSGSASTSIELLGAYSMWDPSARGGSGEFLLNSTGLVSTLSTNPASATSATATLGRTTGKYVYKVTSGNLTSGLSIGLSTNASTTLGSSSSSVAWAMTGAVTCNGSTIGTAATWGASTALYVAVDLTNALGWFRVGTGGNWNNSGTANPDTGTGGFSLSGLSLTAAICPARGAAAGAGTETTGFTIDGTAASHGLTTFSPWDTFSTGVAGTLATTEGADTAAFAGSLNAIAALAVTEGADTAAFTGAVVVSGALAVTEGADTASLSGLTAALGTLAATEGADSAAMAGQVVTAGSLATTEGADTAAFAGSVVSGPSGSLAATEGPDAAAFAGKVISSGPLATTEAADVAAFAGLLAARGGLAVTEAADAAAFNGSVSGVLGPGQTAQLLLAGL